MQHPLLSAPATSSADAKQRPDPSADGPAWARSALLALLAAGAALRLFQYAADRSLWLDESLIVHSIVGRTLPELFRPLEAGQTAPLGFLVLVELSTLLFGEGEYALRLVPLLAGMAALFLSVPVARRFVSPNAVPVAVAIVALAPYLIYYASEVKPYALDALASLVILGLAADHAAAPRLEPRRTLLLLLAGMVAVWLSQPAVFVLAGVGVVLGARALRARDARAVRALAAVGAAWGASFGTSYLLARHNLTDPAYMEAFWESGFMPLAPTSWAEWTWLPRSIARVFQEPLGVIGDDQSQLQTVQTTAGLLASGVGVFWMARARDVRLALLLAPVFLTLAASALRLYPFGGNWWTGGRVLIFLIPSFVFLMAEGTERIRLILGRRAGPLAAVLLVAAMLAPSAYFAATRVPQARSEMKPLLEYAAEHRQPGDVMYVYYGARHAFEYYAPRYGWDQGNAVAGACARLQPVGYLRDLDRLRGRPRVWLLFTEGQVEDLDERSMMLAYLTHLGRRLDDRMSHGVYLYLYDLSAEPTMSGRFPEERVGEYPASDVARDCRGPWGPDLEAP